MEETSKAKRETIIKRIQALMAKTAENGCSEAEAMAAAAKVDELMQEYDLTYKDVEVEVREARYGSRGRPFAGGTARRRTYHEVSNTTRAIAEYFDVRVWHSGADLVYFGEQYDTELAHNMTDLLRVAMDGAWMAYQRSEERRGLAHHGRSLRMSFMLGMANRICERLRELKRARTQSAQRASGTGTALVLVAKRDVVTEKFAATGIKLKSSSSSRGSGNFSGSAYGAGKAAGDRVNLSGGAIGGSQRKLGHG